MATNLGRTIIRHVTARRFVGGTGGNLRLSSSLARPKTRPRHRFNKHSSDEGFSVLETGFLLFHALPDDLTLTKTMEDSPKASGSKATKEFNAEMMKPLEEKEVSRELCEAKLKQNIQSGSASKD